MFLLAVTSYSLSGSSEVIQNSNCFRYILALSATDLLNAIIKSSLPERFLGLVQN